MAEILFYQLEATPLSAILPDLLKRSLARGLRVGIETVAQDNVAPLSALLWGHEDVAFLPHGHGEDAGEGQPIWLCADAANPNSASYRFFVEGALPQSLEGLERAIILFDSNSEEALASARNEWKKRKAEGHEIRFYKMDENGKWQNLA
ncbi:MAG: DNA polymerase III subunit chi [Alphaproteobacteria bacterium]|nr:DNA polymerase III subunit chi [Alphaproteobacteria bacterium]